MFKFAEALARRGHEVKIFAANYPKFYDDYPLPSRLKIYVDGFLPYQLKTMFWRIEDEINIRNRLKVNYDFIFGYQVVDAVRAAYYGVKLGVPSVNFIFECPDWYERRLKTDWTVETKVKNAVHRLWKWRIFKKSLIQSGMVLTISNLTKMESEKWLGKEIYAVIHPGVDTEFVDQIPDQNEEVQIVCVGRLVPYKNVDKIIMALNSLDKPPKLVVIGDGPLRAELEKLASDLKVSCEFKGRISDRDKWIEIKKSMFLVSPTSFEGSADVPSEAMYCKKPALVSDIPIMKEDYGDSIEYFKENDIKDLAGKIDSLSKNKEYRENRGAEGKKFVEENYTLKKAAEKIENILLDYKSSLMT